MVTSLLTHCSYHSFALSHRFYHNLNCYLHFSCSIWVRLARSRGGVCSRVEVFRRSRGWIGTVGIFGRQGRVAGIGVLGWGRVAHIGIPVITCVRIPIGRRGWIAIVGISGRRRVTIVWIASRRWVAIVGVLRIATVGISAVVGISIRIPTWWRRAPTIGVVRGRRTRIRVVSRTSARVEYYINIILGLPRYRDLNWGSFLINIFISYLTLGWAFTMTKTI